MGPYILKRVLFLIPVFFFISIITFGLMHSVEGGPWDSERKLPEATIQNFNKKYGLDKPIWRQYADFLTNAVHGDLGISFQQQNRSVTSLIARDLRATAVLGVLALLVAALGGVSLGILAALNRNRSLDYVSVLFASVGSALPSFVLGILLIYLFSVQLHLLPTRGWDMRNGLIPGLLPQARQLLMPVVTLAALPMALLARITRASFLEVLNQDYMRTARAKGLTRRSILLRHGLRNAVIPVLTVAGPITANLVTGSFIVEQVFSIPGIGRNFVQSVNARDYGLIMGTTLFYAFVISMANLAVDVAYAAVDPRIRFR
jgi:oligopeptide transport system permease protein